MDDHRDGGADPDARKAVARRLVEHAPQSPVGETGQYKEGIMTSLETIAITDTASPGIEYDAAIDLDGCDSLKVFLFEDLSSIKPLCCIREMNLTYLQ